MTDISNNGSNFSSIELENLYANVWVNCGVTANIGTSYNVSSLVDIGTARLGVNFSKPFNSANYCAFVTKQVTAGSSNHATQADENRSSSRSDFTFAGGGFTDPNRWNVYIVGSND